jgi:hypothetical protein
MLGISPLWLCQDSKTGQVALAYPYEGGRLAVSRRGASELGWTRRLVLYIKL